MLASSVLRSIAQWYFSFQDVSYSIILDMLYEKKICEWEEFLQIFWSYVMFHRKIH